MPESGLTVLRPPLKISAVRDMRLLVKKYSYNSSNSEIIWVILKIGAASRDGEKRPIFLNVENYSRCKDST